MYTAHYEMGEGVLHLIALDPLRKIHVKSVFLLILTIAQYGVVKFKY